MEKHWDCIGIYSTLQLSTILFWYTCATCFLFKIQSILASKINQNPIKNPSQKRIDFWIECLSDICGFGLRLGSILAPILPPKPQKKGGGAKGGRDLWQRLRARSAQEAPDPQNSCPRIPIGSKNISQWHPLDPKKHRLGTKEPRNTLLPHNWAAHAPEESPDSRNNQTSTSGHRKTNWKWIEYLTKKTVIAHQINSAH